MARRPSRTLPPGGSVRSHNKPCAFYRATLRSGVASSVNQRCAPDPEAAGSKLYLNGLCLWLWLVSAPYASVDGRLV